ncbi:MAG TPA: hypothetical protein VLE53_19515 [Gemmatimonadaceae bacterium]|nr:hypothetical protein [Gemmatimonadaceae bacterium]
MMLLRRLGASLASLALLTTALTAFLPCGMRAGESHALSATTAQAGADAPRHAHHHEQHRAPDDGDRASPSPDEPGAPMSSCPVMGPCALHLLGSASQEESSLRPGGATVAVAPALAPPSRTLAPELPPPRV